MSRHLVLHVKAQSPSDDDSTYQAARLHSEQRSLRHLEIKMSQHSSRDCKN